jgi:anhydro-N-acetylmuramic acid kinase
MRELYIGVMTGTSLDGLDAVLADFSTPQPRVIASVALDYPSKLKTEMLALQTGSDGLGINELHRSCVASLNLAHLHVKAIAGLLSAVNLKPAEIAAIGVHGQTVRHASNGAQGSPHPYTVQLIDASTIAEATRCTVVSDFRSRDIAAGGQGAPLVPAFHAALCAALPMPVTLVNIGGFANVSLLQGDGEVAGFDTGPGNVLMDAWAQQHIGKPYDAGGAWAATGTVHTALLARLLAHPYFAAPLPKSTGREAFDLNWLNRCIAACGSSLNIPPADVQATLCELTVHSIASAMRQYAPQCKGLYVCGGGALNTHLMQRLQALLSHPSHCPVATTAALGVDPQHLEALAFAWLARQCMLGLAGNVPGVTGAAGPRVLGCISPA